MADERKRWLEDWGDDPVDPNSPEAVAERAAQLDAVRAELSRIPRRFVNEVGIGVRSIQTERTLAQDMALSALLGELRLGVSRLVDLPVTGHADGAERANTTGWEGTVLALLATRDALGPLVPYLLPDLPDNLPETSVPVNLLLDALFADALFVKRSALTVTAFLLEEGIDPADDHRVLSADEDLSVDADYLVRLTDGLPHRSLIARLAKEGHQNPESLTLSDALCRVHQSNHAARREADAIQAARRRSEAKDNRGKNGWK